ncbi:MAG: DUF975 family protein [Firmicutes bacterium]|nr:DUF975 family protein [Bacillota bacterium]
MRTGEFKRRARAALKGKYFIAVGVYALVMIIEGLFTRLSNTFVTLYTSTYNPTYLLWAAIVFIGSILFVSVPMSVSITRYFIVDAEGKAKISELLYPYKTNLGNIILTMIVKELLIFLWSLLLIIPGIIKTYSYFLVDFIIAENPDISRKRAFEISKNAMDGHKMKAFLLSLSFIGYIFLSLFTAGIGMFFLYPYMQAAYTQFYFEMKELAFEKGYIEYGELKRTDFEREG